MKVRPFTERLPTLDAWNAAVQRSLTPTMSVEVAYVGNKGTHTLSDGDGNNTNPNEAAIFLPAQYSVNGTPLHYDGSVASGVSASGGTSQTSLLQRFTYGTLPACGGPCGWTSGISYYGDDQDTHYNAIQTKFTKTYTHGLSINLNYAYARGRDAASSFATWDKQAVIGNDSAIRRSAFTAYGLYKLPFGHGTPILANANPIINYLVEGFELSPVFQWQSGLPYSLSYSDCSAVIPGDAPCQPNGNPNNIARNIKGVPGNGITFFSPVISPSDVTAGKNLCNAVSVSGGIYLPWSGSDWQHHT